MRFNANSLRIILYPIISFVSFAIFINFTNPENFDKIEILSILISVLSILVAIVVTYLFSKLFAEKSIKIERKKEIDILSIKVTYFRRIAFHIRSLHEFWRFNDVNIKSIVDHNYEDLTYEQYRGYDVPGLPKFTYEQSTQIDKDIYGNDGQAYLALKGLEDNDNRFSFFSEFNPKNYSLDDISRYKEYTNSFWYFLDRSDDVIVSFNGLSNYWLNMITELYQKITGKGIDTDNYKKDIKELFGYFDTELFEKQFYLTSLNSNKMPVFFKKSLLNMVIFLALLICGLFVFVINLNQEFTFLSTTIILSFFVANTVDLIILTTQSIKSELDIKEIFSI